MEPEHILANMKHLHSDVTRQTMQVLERLNQTAETVVEAAKSVEKNKNILHRQNEQFLMGQVKKIQESVENITGLENSMSAAVINQAKLQMQPVLSELEAVLKRLNNKDSIALELIKDTSATQARWSRTGSFIAVGFVLLLLFSSFGGFYVGQEVTSKQITKNAEWLSSEEGQFADQLRGTGSLAALATCDETRGWKLEGNICHPQKTGDGIMYGWKVKK